MTTYNTGNPIGSTDPKDLYDNAQNLDALVNSTTELSHADRMAVQRKTWHGMEVEFAQFLADSAYQDLGVYGAGIEVTRYNQVFLKDGEFYRAAASLGLPYTTTGLWASESGSFVGVGDAVLRQDLGAPGGSDLVGYDGGTAQDVLDESKPMANYTALSAYTGRATGVRITQSGLAGCFQRDDADTTSADNGGTIIVDAIGRRWKRLFSGFVEAKFFGADPTGVTDSAAAIEAAIAFIKQNSNAYTATGEGAKSAVLLFSAGKYRVSRKVLVPGNIVFLGDGATILCHDGGATFESGYYVGGVLTSNMALSDGDVTLYGLTGLRFENLTFVGGALPLNLRCAIWQSGIFNCSFYDCQTAFQTKQCFYFKYEGIKVRGQHATLPSDNAIKLLRASNRIELNNVSVSHRDKGIRLGETGAENASANISLNNSSLEALAEGFEFVGTIYGFSAHDVYVEAVSSVFFDTDGALKYDFNIEPAYVYSSAYYVDLSGLRQSYIGPVRDNVGDPVKSIVRLRQGTNGNQAIVALSNLLDASTGTNRYQLSDGVITTGALTKYTSGSTAVVLSQDRQKNAVVSKYADQLPIHETGWYGIAVNYVIGSQTGTVVNTAGTEMYFNTNMFWSEYTAVNYSVKVTPNAGSGAGGTTPAPIYLKGIAIGSHVTQIGTAGHNAYTFQDPATGCMRIGFDGFGTNNTDPAYAWMRNGQYTSEGIVKLIA